LKVPERSWCAFELEKASQWAIPTFMWTHQVTSFEELEDKIGELDIRRASATSKIDQERIHKAIQSGIGYDVMNQRLRVFLGDRLRFFKSAVSKYRSQLAALMQDIEEARRQNDEARLAVLEAEKVGQQRLMQMEVDMKAAQDASKVALQIDPARIQEEEERQQQRQQRQQQLEKDLEEARCARDQAAEAALQIRAEAKDLAQELQQVRDESKGSSATSSVPRLVQEHTVVTTYPVVAIPARVVATRAQFPGMPAPAASVHFPVQKAGQIYQISQAVTVSRFM